MILEVTKALIGGASVNAEIKFPFEKISLLERKVQKLVADAI